MTELVGKTLSKVHIEKLLNRGGMAEVYLGTHTTLSRRVAIKVLHRHLEENTDLKQRFEREAQVLAGLRHPNIVQVYDFDIIENQPYIIMEYVPGLSLASYLNSVHAHGGRLTLKQIGQLLLMLSDALDYAHKNGIVHRDIKPANILLTSKTDSIQSGQPLPPDAQAILTDFGLLRLTQAASQTSSGTISGTPAYMSPEQARGDKVDSRSDLYSLGITLYEMLAGKVPFEADTSMAVLFKHIQEAPPPIEGLPTSLQIVLDRVLAKNPTERFASAPDLLKAFLDASNLSQADLIPGQLQAESLNARATLNAAPPPTPKSSTTQLWPVWATVFAGLLLAALAWWQAISAPQPPPVFDQTAHAIVLATPAPFTAAPNMPAHESPAQPADHSQPENPANTENTATFGALRFYNVAGLLDEVILSSWDLPAPEDKFQHEVWLVGDEIRRSLGILPLPDENGLSSLFFIDEQGRNLLARFGRVEISLEPNPDPNPNSSGNIVYSSGLPPLALEHLRHLFVGFEETPNQIGLIVGLETHTLLVDEHTQQMLAAYQQDNLVETRRQAEIVHNLLVGNQAGNYGDLDADGTVSDPGDGFGLLLNGDQVGYIEGTISHTLYAMNMPDASLNIVIHGEHVLFCARNIETWAVELTTIMQQILMRENLDNETRALILQALSLSDRMKNGRDLNGNESIDPIAGEGGLTTALEHAIYMLDMPLFTGPNRLPLAEPAESSSSPHQNDEMPPGYAP